jgi:hypothetical protein
MMGFVARRAAAPVRLAARKIVASGSRVTVFILSSIAGVMSLM